MCYSPDNSKSNFHSNGELKLWKFNFFSSPFSLDQNRDWKFFFYIRGERSRKMESSGEFSILCCIKRQCSVSRENQYSVNWFVSYQLSKLSSRSWVRVRSNMESYYRKTFAGKGSARCLFGIFLMGTINDFRHN